MRVIRRELEEINGGGYNHISLCTYIKFSKTKLKIF